MAHAVMTSMMAKIDELKEQMTDAAYLALCDELMRLYASTPPEAPATPPITEREPEPEPEPEPQVIDEDDPRSFVEMARQMTRMLIDDDYNMSDARELTRRMHRAAGRPDPFPHLRRPEPEPQVIDEDDYNRSVVERARQMARDLGRPDPFPHLPY